MAGKTFTGIGVDDLLKESPPLGQDDAVSGGEEIRGVYSGPTVVDDDKVAEGLLRLRSLEGRPEETANPPSLIVDMGSSEPTRVGMVAGRSTALGRSLGTEIPGQQMVVHTENIRGTMFGHSIHLPELQDPVDAEEVISGPIYVPPQAVPTQLVPYQHRAQPDFGGRDYPGEALPFHRRETILPEEGEVSTETISRGGRWIYSRVAFGVATAALVAAALITWTRLGAGDADDVRRPGPGVAATPTAAARPPSAPPSSLLAPRAAAATPVGVAAEIGAAPATRGPTLADQPAVAAPVPAPADRPAAAGPAEISPAGDATHPRRRPGHPERRHGSGEPIAGPPSQAAASAKPPSKRRVRVEEDPDATLPPSSTE